MAAPPASLHTNTQPPIPTRTAATTAGPPLLLRGAPALVMTAAATAASALARAASTAGGAAASTAARAAGGAAKGAAKVRGGGRLADIAPRSVVEDIFRCSMKKQQGVSLKYMMDFGANPVERQLMVSAQFLHKELPVRLAHRVAELENLPRGLSLKPQVRKVRDWYVESFRELRAIPELVSAQDEREFNDLLSKIKMRHNNVVPLMAMGVASLKEDLRHQQIHELPDIHLFLDRFYMSRIGIRMLIGQHVALHDKAQQDCHVRVGLIDTQVSPVQVAQEAIADARYMCSREYGSSPEVTVFGDPDFTFAYVPEHLHHMVFELVKNSLKAVADKYADADEEPPAIRIVVAAGKFDITVKVSDEGGGIPRADVKKIWTYLYTTAASPLERMAEEGDDDLAGMDGGGPAVLAGYGYGLPVSRLYARYFGGDLQVISMDGYGTDAYLHLNKLGDGEEPLP